MSVQSVGISIIASWRSLRSNTRRGADDVFRPGTYAAFISYRHVPRDRGWAVWLHGALETFVLPRALRAAAGGAKIGRVFRDEDETAASANLGRAIETALEASAWLVVVCSPEAKASKWVNAEVAYFKKLGRAERILALLVNGEPATAFPDALYSIRPSSVAEERLGHDEPLAADVRPGESSPRYARRLAALKLIATIVGCKFDELRQRDQARRNRRLVVAATTASAALVVFAALAIVAVRGRNAAIVSELGAFMSEMKARDNERTASHQKEVAESARLQAEADRAVAEERQRLAQSRALAIEARNAADRPDTAFLLAEQAMRTRPTREALSALLGLLIEYPRLERTLYTWHDSRQRMVNVLAVEPGGKALVAGYADGSVVFWRTGQPSTELPDGEATYLVPARRHAFAGISTLVFHPGGGAFAYATDAGTIHIWDWNRKLERFTLRRYPDDGTPSGMAPYWRPHALAFHPETDILAAGGGDGRITLWNLATRGRVPPDFGDPIPPAENAHRIGVQTLVFTADGSTLVSGHGDGTVQLWDAKNEYRRGRTFRTGTNGVPGLAIDWDRKRLAWGGGSDGSVTVQDVQGEQPRLLRTPGQAWAAGRNDARTLAFSSDGAYLASGHLNGRLTVWDVASGRPIDVMASGHAPFVSHVAFTRGDRAFVSGGPDGVIRIWRAGPESFGRGLGQSAPWYDAAFADDGAVLAMVTMAHTLEWWDAVNDRRLAQHSFGPADTGVALAFTGRRVVTVVSRQGHLMRCTPEGCASVPTAVAGRTVMHASMGPRAAFWVEWGDRTFRCTPAACHQLPGPRPAGTHPGAVSRDGRRWATAGWDSADSGQVHLCSADGCGLLDIGPKGPSTWIGGLAFDPSGSRLVVGTGDGRVAFFDAEKGTRLGQPVEAHSGGVEVFAFRSDGAVLATGGRDGTIVLWDVQARLPIGRPFPGPDLEQLNGLTPRPNSTDVLVQYKTGRTIWLDTDQRSWRARACAAASRNFTAGEWERYIGSGPCEATCRVPPANGCRSSAARAPAPF